MDGAFERSEAAKEFADVSAVLRPRSVAVIGASDQPGNVGGAAVRFFRKFTSPCLVYPVNLRQEMVAGLPAFASVAALPSTPDLAILAVPAAAVPDAIRECVGRWNRCRNRVGRRLCRGRGARRRAATELVAICRETGFLLLGPNCLGVIDTHAPMTASFASIMLSVDRLLPGQHLHGQPERRARDNRAGAGATAGIRLPLHDQYGQ